MPNIVPLSELFTDQNNLNSVDAKKLHSLLGVKSKFYDWINPKLSDFKIDEDYSRLKNKSLTLQDKVDVNYILSFNVAKKLAMMTRSKKGEEVRDYFLDCENKVISEMPLLIARIERIEEQLRNKKTTNLNKVIIGYQENLFGIKEPIYAGPIKQSECTPVQIAEHYLRSREKQATGLINGNVAFCENVIKLNRGK